jgi:RNA polymerase sigma factor (TIGR02999 family)
MAGRQLRRERADHTLQPTALVNEAWLRLIDAKQIDWQGKTHFLSIAAKVMRRILVEHARGHDAQKRGGELQRQPLTGVDLPQSEPEADVLAIDEALQRLARLDERQARVAELRFFGGLSVEEAAGVLGVSERTVKSDWRVARAWLRAEVGGGESSAGLQTGPASD